MKKFTKVMLVILGIMWLIGCFWLLSYQNSSIDRKHCELMESKDTFDGEEVNMLYHWMNPGKYDDHVPSERFRKLYEEKIKYNY